MAIKIKPLGDRVSWNPSEEKEQKKGGIIIPDTAKEKPMESKVAAGDRQERRRWQCHPFRGEEGRYRFDQQVWW